MGRKVLRLAIASLIAAGISGSVRVYSQAIKPVTINVLLRDYSDVNPQVLADAQRVASGIFGPTGVRFSWTNCPLGTSPDSNPACGDQPGPDQLFVRVLRRRPRNDFHESVFGLAIHPSLVSVYFESAQLLVQSMTNSKSYVPRILGCLIAHELGHLLLGENQHAAGGIMQAQWDLKQIQRALQGTLGFTSQQAERMRANAQERINSSQHRYLPVRSRPE